MCHRYDVAALPGCFTPTEILTAWEAGADVIKVFPATALGPTFFKDMRGPLPQIRLMPTGGVTLANAGDWIKAGAVAIGVGTALVDTKAIADGNFREDHRQRAHARRSRPGRTRPASRPRTATDSHGQTPRTDLTRSDQRPKTKDRRPTEDRSELPMPAGPEVRPTRPRKIGRAGLQPRRQKTARRD